MFYHLVIFIYMVFGVVCDTHVSLSLGRKSSSQSVPCNAYMYYKVDVTDPCKDLKIILEVLDGEPNLYVSRGNTKFPTEHSLAWSSYNWGSENLTISSWDPEFSVGTFYIGAHAYCGTDVPTGQTDAKFTLLVQSVNTMHPSDEIILNQMTNGRISANDYLYYRFCVPSTCQYVEVKLENCIDPAKCPTNYAWPELLVSRSIVNPTINDHAWKLASIERRSVYLHQGDDDFYPGHYFIGVYGWCTPQEHCSDDSTCGPCKYAANHAFNLSVIVTDVAGSCESRGPLQLCEAKFETSGSNTRFTKNFTWVIPLLVFVTTLCK